METEYDLYKIRALLTEGFTSEELRRFLYDDPRFRPVYSELSQSSGKAEIIDRIIEYAAQKLMLERLIIWAKESNPAMYRRHQPYKVSPRETPVNIYEQITQSPANLDEQILQILYTYYQQNPKDSEMSLGELIKISKVQRADVIDQLNDLEQMGWLHYQLTTEANRGLVRLSQSGLREAAKITRPETYIEQLDNPYIVGNPIQPDNVKVFLGRFDIAEAITNEIKREGQKPSMLLYGRRRMGKTSALFNISRLTRDPNLLPVYISGQSAKYHNNVNFCYHLVQAINNRLQLDFIDTSIFQQKGFLTKASFIQNPVLTLSEFFDECHQLLESHDKYCLLSIDEYEDIDQYINTSPGNHHERNITRELLVELRDTLQQKPRFIFLFAGIHFLRDLSTVNWSEIFINLKTLHISFLERKDGYNLLTKPVPEMKYQSRALIEQILDITGCQPYFLQGVASELINLLNARDTRIVTKGILDKALEKALDTCNIHFDYIWDSECISEKHKKLLKIISTKESGVPENELTTYQDELRDLIRKELLKKECGLVKLTMPIVKLWMKKNQHIL